MEHPIELTFGERRAAFLDTAEDYAHQRHRVNKKLAKLRRNLKIHTRDTRNYSTKEKTSSIVAANYDIDPAFGEIVLLIAERDLLHAQELRLSLDVEPSRSKAKYLVSKYKRALQNAKKLLEVTENEKDQYTVLELLAYVGLVDGLCSISKKKFQSAIYPLSVARCVLQCINSTASFEKNDLCLDLIDHTIDPALKVALSQGLNLKPTDVGSISKEYATTAADVADSQVYLRRAVEIIKGINPIYITPSNDAEAMLIDSITWCEYKANIKSEDVALAIMKANAGKEQIVESDPSSYDTSLLSFQDAITLQEEQMERENNENDENQEQHIVLTYIKYNSILLKISRDMSLLSSITNPAKIASDISRQKALELLRDALKLNDGILSSIVVLKELPGVSNVDEIYDSLITLSVYFEVQKLHTLAQAFLISNKYQEALALASEANEKLQTLKPFQIEFGSNLPTNATLSGLKSEVSSQLQKLFVLASYSKNAGNVDEKEYLIDNINRFPSESSDALLSSIAPLKIDIKAVNVKPVLFDIAFNYIDYENEENTSSIAEESDVNVGAGEDTKKKGFFGLFGR